MIEEGDRAGKQSEDNMKNILRVQYEMKELNEGVSGELERQIQALDSVYETLQDAESNMNRYLFF